MQQLEDGALRQLFTPDVVTPEQYHDMRRGSVDTPVKRLMMAVLEDALRCFQNYACSKSVHRRRLFAEAERWLCDDQETDGLFTFSTICEALGIEPQYLRSGLKKWRDQKLAGIGVPRLARRSPVIRTSRMQTTGRRSRRQTSMAG